MPIYNLTNQHFGLSGTHSKTMNVSVPGYLLVLFKSEACPNCIRFKDIFMNLANINYGPQVNFGVLDIQNYGQVTQMSKSTSNPITYIPTLIFYSERRPVAKYKGTFDLPSVRKFITDAIGVAQQQEQKLRSQQNQYASMDLNYGQQNGGRAKYMPEFDTGGGNVQMSNSPVGNDTEDFKIPPGVNPKNIPWEIYIQ